MRHAALLAVLLHAGGASASDFEIAANDRSGDVRTVGFRQTWRGLPVVGGQVGFVFAHDRLFAIGSEALPNVAAAIATRPPAATVRARAEAWLGGAVVARAR